MDNIEKIEEDKDKPKLYTGQWSRIKEYRVAGLIPVGISSVTPKWAGVVDTIPKLFPSYYLINSYKQGKMDRDEYEDIYFLNNLIQVFPIYDLGKDIGKLENNSILLCYEKAGDFCHRHLVADMFRKSGYDIEEYKPNRKNYKFNNLTSKVKLGKHDIVLEICKCSSSELKGGVEARYINIENDTDIDGLILELDRELVNGATLWIDNAYFLSNLYKILLPANETSKLIRFIATIM